MVHAHASSSSGPNRRIRRLFVAVWLIVTTFVVGIGCGGVKWPNCDNDENCNVEGHTGVCLNGKCVTCRDNRQCKTGQVCSGGECTRPAGYCDERSPCPGGIPCINNRCEAKIGDTAFVACDDLHPCPAGERCENGHCVAPPKGGPGCTDFPAPHFDFEQAEIREAGKQTLQKLAQCLTTGTLKGQRVLLTGHCDNRGEQEYNMSLGALRSEAIKSFLTAAGVPADRVLTSSRGKLDAVGTDEAGWENDRRVDIEVR